MKQPIKKNKKQEIKYICSKPSKISHRGKKRHKDYGTSKLEKDFAHDFLEKLGLKFVYQYEAKDIKRFFDFAVTAFESYPYKYILKEGVNAIDQNAQLFIPQFLIEIDGDYYHSNPLTVNQNKLNPMQKHNKFVDKLKDEWCGMHCIPLLRIWEYDIRHNPKKVMDMLAEYSSKAEKAKEKIENKKRPH